MNWSLIGKVLFTILVIGIIGGGAYYLGTQSSIKPTPTPAPTETPEVTTQGEEISSTPAPTDMQKKSDKGIIEGTLGFPAEGIPSLTVYAINVKSGDGNFFVKTGQNQGSFMIEDVTPGTYHVVAYTDDSKLSGAWSKMVPCGLSASCGDHTLIDVEVKAGETTKGIEVKDWYAPEGTFPSKPQ